MMSEIDVDDANHHADTMSSSTGTHTTYSSTWDGSSHSNMENSCHDQRGRELFERTSSVRFTKGGNSCYGVVAVNDGANEDRINDPVHSYTENSCDDQRGGALFERISSVRLEKSGNSCYGVVAVNDGANEDRKNDHKDDGSVVSGDFADNDFDALVGEFFCYLREKENSASTPSRVAPELPLPRVSNDRVLTPRNSEKGNHDNHDGSEKKQRNSSSFVFDDEEVHADVPTPRKPDEGCLWDENFTRVEYCRDAHDKKEVASRALLEENEHDAMGDDGNSKTTCAETKLSGGVSLAFERQPAILCYEGNDVEGDENKKVNDTDEVLPTNSTNIVASPSRPVATIETHSRGGHAIKSALAPRVKVDEQLEPSATLNKSPEGNEQEVDMCCPSGPARDEVRSDDPYSEFYKIWTRKGLMGRTPTPLKTKSSTVKSGAVDAPPRHNAYVTAEEEDIETDCFPPKRVLQWPPLKSPDCTNSSTQSCSPSRSRDISSALSTDDDENASRKKALDRTSDATMLTNLTTPGSSKEIEDGPTCHATNGVSLPDREKAAASTIGCAMSSNASEASTEFDADLELSRILDDDDSIQADQKEVTDTDATQKDESHEVRELLARARKLLGRQQDIGDGEDTDKPNTEQSDSAGLIVTSSMQKHMVGWEPDASFTVASSISVVAETSSVVLHSCSPSSISGEATPLPNLIIGREPDDASFIVALSNSVVAETPSVDHRSYSSCSLGGGESPVPNHIVGREPEASLILSSSRSVVAETSSVDLQSYLSYSLGGEEAPVPNHIAGTEPDASFILASSSSVVGKTSSVALHPYSPLSFCDGVTHSDFARDDGKTSFERRSSHLDGYFADDKSHCKTEAAQAATPSNAVDSGASRPAENAGNETTARNRCSDIDGTRMKGMNRSFPHDASDEPNRPVISPSVLLQNAIKNAAASTSFGSPPTKHTPKRLSERNGDSFERNSSRAQPLDGMQCVETSKSGIVLEPSAEYQKKMINAPSTAFDRLSSTGSHSAMEKSSPRSAFSNRSSLATLMASLKTNVAELTAIPSTVQFDRNETSRMPDDPFKRESGQCRNEGAYSVTPYPKKSFAHLETISSQENKEALVLADANHLSLEDGRLDSLARVSGEEELESSSPFLLSSQSAAASVVSTPASSSGCRSHTVALPSKSAEGMVLKTQNDLSGSESLSHSKLVMARTVASGCEQGRENGGAMMNTCSTPIPPSCAVLADDDGEEQVSASSTVSRLRAVEAGVAFDSPLTQEESVNEQSYSGIPSLTYSSSESVKDPPLSREPLVRMKESIPHEGVMSEEPSSALNAQQVKVSCSLERVDEPSSATASATPKPPGMRKPNNKFASILNRWEEKIDHCTKQNEESSPFLSPSRKNTTPYNGSRKPLSGAKETTRRKSTGEYVAPKERDAASSNPIILNRWERKIDHCTKQNEKSGFFLSPSRKNMAPYHGSRNPLFGAKESMRRKSAGEYVAPKEKDVALSNSSAASTRRQSIDVSCMPIPGSSNNESDSKLAMISSSITRTAPSRPEDYWDGMIQKDDEPNDFTWVSRRDTRRESLESSHLMETVPKSEVASSAENIDARNIKDDGEPCTCLDWAFSGNEHVKDFFLPQVGMAHYCGKKNPTILIDSDPIALRHILRAWQVDFLRSCDIYRCDQLVKASQNRAGTLAGAMRKWRLERGMTCPKTMSCVMALHVWSRTCKYYVRTIRKQLANGMVEVEPPTLSDVMTTRDEGENAELSFLSSEEAEEEGGVDSNECM